MTINNKKKILYSFDTVNMPIKQDKKEKSRKDEKEKSATKNKIAKKTTTTKKQDNKPKIIKKKGK